MLKLLSISVLNVLFKVRNVTLRKDHIREIKIHVNTVLQTGYIIFKHNTCVSQILKNVFSGQLKYF